MFSNMSRKADKEGNMHFISFLSAVLSRLAYMNDTTFLTKYNAIMGPVIHPQILTAINNVKQDKLDDLLNDNVLFNLTGSNTDLFNKDEIEFSGHKYIDILAANMPQNINIINGDVPGTVSFPPSIPPVPTAADAVKYISIGWSNYGEIYVVADKRMPNTIFVIFRGTYSAKTTALYSKPTSIVPLTVCKDPAGNPEQFLYGIFKATAELIHTIIESIQYLAESFLGATEPNSVKIFTTGHSLGGAMCTNFAYIWMGIKKTAPYNTNPYHILADNIICISLGAPRCMGKLVALKFCNLVKNKKILYLRITTRGDPVPGLPPKTGYEHPCSANEEMRKVVSEDCNANLIMRPLPNVEYTKPIDCQNYKTRTYVPNMISHTIYLDIVYTKAVDIVKFIKGAGTAQEIGRTQDGSTVCRLIMGQTNNYKIIFFNVNHAREKPVMTDAAEERSLLSTNVDAALAATSGLLTGGFKIGGAVSEDNRMNKAMFNTILGEMKPLTGNLNPLLGTLAVAKFTGQMMPDLGCPSTTMSGGMPCQHCIGGRKTRNQRKKNKNKNRKRKCKKTLKKRRR